MMSEAVNRPSVRIQLWGSPGMDFWSHPSSTLPDGVTIGVGVAIVELGITLVVFLVEVTKLEVTGREADLEVALGVSVTGSGLMPGGRDTILPEGGGAVFRVQTESEVLEDEFVDVELEDDNPEVVTEVRKLVDLEEAG
jgi:hypothetical protein